MDLAGPKLRTGPLPDGSIAPAHAQVLRELGQRIRAGGFPSAAASGTPSRTARSATISQVAAAAASIQARPPEPSLLAWWSMVRSGVSAKSAALRSRIEPTRERSPQSHSTTRS